MRAEPCSWRPRLSLKPHGAWYGIWGTQCILSSPRLLGPGDYLQPRQTAPWRREAQLMIAFICAFTLCPHVLAFTHLLPDPQSYPMRAVIVYHTLANEDTEG